MVLKVFWNGDFGRWSVELPKQWAEGKCWIWGADWDAGQLGEMRAESQNGLLTLIVKSKTDPDF